ncbi:hypothetical protein L9W92_15640 [Pelotomaculum terephthalicicum JT]|uniref:hypothetical protein n=1 Tax=Pelotomaculum TaxID=191373 RepID=UPI0009C55E10|nr:MULTISPECIES: hypothetical protein [Pelotomaculum]MCG9969444.1 hypothetical protein [Pelotomaculum terephthalicicum JT]OPX89370.1 MAG: hypothetical protein A4E54_01005 [Pelotomaculum sp. PtaB.Bin117]
MQREQNYFTDKEYSTGKNLAARTEKEHEATDCNEYNTALFSVREIMELKELLQIKDKLMTVVEEEGISYNSINSINSINNNVFDDIKPQTIHISQKVFKEFKMFTKEHNTTLKQAVSSALLHYMNSFKNK